MRKLPFWHLTSKTPAFVDADSATVLEQTAKLYGAMQEMIEEHNSFMESMTKTINDFTVNTQEDLEKFKTCITNIMNNYIQMLDTKIGVIEHRVDNLEQNGGMVFVEYNETNEELNIGNTTYDEMNEELILGGKQ